MSPGGHGFLTMRLTPVRLWRMDPSGRGSQSSRADDRGARTSRLMDSVKALSRASASPGRLMRFRPWRKARAWRRRSSGGKPRSVAVADQFDVALAGDRGAAGRALDAHGAFPVARADDQLLIGQARRDLEAKVGAGNGQAPAARVAHAARGARSMIEV